MIRDAQSDAIIVIEAAKSIAQHEDFVAYPTPDPRHTGQQINIGYGTRMTGAEDFESYPIARAQAWQLLLEKIDACIDELQQIFGQRNGWLDLYQEVVLIEMIYALGRQRFEKFIGMIDALKRNDFEAACFELLDSSAAWDDWHRERSMDLYHMLKYNSMRPEQLARIGAREWTK